MTRDKIADSSIAMKGEGYYSLHTRGTKHVIDNTTALALGALDAMSIEGTDAPFTIADFGAAAGGTSLSLIRELIRKVRLRVPHRPITITYTDLPRNDYSALFQMVHGDRTHTPSYLAEHDQVWIFTAGTSFYLPVFPHKVSTLASRQPPCTG